MMVPARTTPAMMRARVMVTLVGLRRPADGGRHCRVGQTIVMSVATTPRGWPPHHGVVTRKTRPRQQDACKFCHLSKVAWAYGTTRARERDRKSWMHDRIATGERPVRAAV